MTNIYCKGYYYSAGSGNHSWINARARVCVCVCVHVCVAMTVMMFQGAGSNLQELRFSQWCCSKIQVFCDVMLCHWANSSQLFGTITAVQEEYILLVLLPINTASHSRRRESSFSTSNKPKPSAAMQTACKPISKCGYQYMYQFPFSVWLSMFSMSRMFSTHIISIPGYLVPRLTFWNGVYLSSHCS